MLRLHIRRAAFVIAVIGVFASSAGAQQFVVDDAGITDPGACQLEGWLGQSAGWVLPACTPISRTEITLGLGYADEPRGDHTHRHLEFVAQAKVHVLPDDPGALGASVVAGLGLGPSAQATGAPLESVFAFLPLTYSFQHEGAFLHFNGGWSYEIEEGLHRAIYGVRGDVVLHERVTVIGELFGEGPDLGLQGGLRISVIPDRLLLDATFGEALSGDTPSIGLTLGVAWTPEPFFTPLR